AAMLTNVAGSTGAADSIASATAEALPSETARADETYLDVEITDRTAKVKSLQALRVMPLFDSDNHLAGFNVIAVAATDEPGWTNGRLIPYSPVVNPADNFLRFDFVADAPESGSSGQQHFVVAQAVVPAHGAVGVEVFASTNSLRQGESDFLRDL
ncbi:MAG: hypothetical protein K1X67_06395, partial [Fimbriimonadaceae bacterium]|nr:hypothetical protein [Fimbriimonadaceae bacterium]